MFISKAREFIRLFLKIFKRAFHKFYTDQGFIISNGLAFKTIVAMVPVLLIIGAAFKTISVSFIIYKEKLTDLLKNYIVPTSFDTVSQWIEKILDKSGTISLISIIVFFYFTIDLLFTLDNQIERFWSRRKNRSIVRKVLKYWMLLTAIPLLLGGYFYYSGFIRSFFEGLPFFNITFFEKTLFNFISFILLVSFFFIIYYVIPSIKVDLLKAAVISFLVAVIWLILRSIYTYYSILVLDRWSIVYGSFASLLMFIFWTSINWVIVLFSVEFLCVWQNKLYMSKVNFQTLFLFDVGLIIFILNQFYNDFSKRGRGITAKMLSERMQYSIEDMREILDILIKENILTSNNERIKRFYLKRDISNFKLSDIESIVWNRFMILQNKTTEELKDICQKISAIYSKKRFRKVIYLKEIINI